MTNTEAGADAVKYALSQDALDQVFAGGSVSVSLFPRASVADKDRAIVESYPLDFVVLYPGIGFFGTFGSVHNPFHLLKTFGANHIPASGSAAGAYGYYSFANVVLNWSSQIPMLRVYSGSIYGKMVYRLRPNFQEICKLNEDLDPQMLERVYALSAKGARFKVRITMPNLVYLCPVHTLEVRNRKIRLDTRFQSVPVMVLQSKEALSLNDEVAAEIASRRRDMSAEDTLSVSLVSQSAQSLLHFVVDGTEAFHYEFASAREYRIQPSDITLFADCEETEELGSMIPNGKV